MLRASSGWGHVEGNSVEYNPGLQLVLKAGVDVNLRDLQDETPLMRVVESNNHAFAKILVRTALFCSSFVTSRTLINWCVAGRAWCRRERGEAQLQVELHATLQSSLVSQTILKGWRKSFNVNVVWYAVGITTQRWSSFC